LRGRGVQEQNEHSAQGGRQRCDLSHDKTPSGLNIERRAASLAGCTPPGRVPAGRQMTADGGGKCKDIEGKNDRQ
jgi:hypothetical protein